MHLYFVLASLLNLTESHARTTERDPPYRQRDALCSQHLECGTVVSGRDTEKRMRASGRAQETHDHNYFRT